MRLKLWVAKLNEQVSCEHLAYLMTSQHHLVHVHPFSVPNKAANDCQASENTHVYAELTLTHR